MQRTSRHAPLLNTPSCFGKEPPCLVGLAMLAVLGLAACPRAAHAQGYTFTTFDYPKADDTAAYGLNNSGQIVGSYDYIDSASGKTVTYGFTLSAAALASGPTPEAFASYGVGGTYTEFDAVNDSGQIVGDYARSDGTGPGFLLNGLGHTDFLPPPRRG